MSNFIAVQHQLLDNIAVAIESSNFDQARKYYQKLANNVTKVKPKFDPHTGYTVELLTNWMQELLESIIEEDSAKALEAQSAVYEMLDSLI